MDITDQIIDDAHKFGLLSFDIEHPPDLDKDSPGFRLSGCSFATKNYSCYLTDIVAITKVCKACFPKEDIECIAFNGKYDLQCLVAVKVITAYEYPATFCDPMVAENLLDENRFPGELGLKPIILARYGHAMMKYEIAWAFGEYSKEFAEYATEDARWELRLWQDVKPEMVKDGVHKLFTKILMPAELAFADMETIGMGWDIDKATELLAKCQKKRDEIQKEIFEEIGGLNLGSGDQLAKRLFEDLGYSSEGIEKTASGKRLSTDAEAMEKLAKKYPVCKKIVFFRTCNQLIGTFIEPLTRRCVEDVNGRIHPTYWIVSTTGRTRCQNPNLQNIPSWIHTRPGFEGLNIKNAFVPAKGRRMIVADYSQIELRVEAHVSQDAVFLETFREWCCTVCNKKGQHNVILHKCPECGTLEHPDAFKGRPVSFWHGGDLHTVTTMSIPALKGNRQNGKTCNFALIYKASAWKMHYEYPELSVKEWQVIIDQYFEKYQGVQLLHINLEQVLSESGIYQDIFGRKRRISRDEIRKSPKHALNQFVNFPIQAPACELLELVMGKMRNKWITEGTYLKEVFITNMVHDELVFEVAEDRVDYYAQDIADIMENAVQLRVPIRADVHIVDNWGQLKDL